MRRIRVEFLSRLYIAELLGSPTSPIIACQRAACERRREGLVVKRADPPQGVGDLALEMVIAQLEAIIGWLKEMRERGIDITAARSKHLDRFTRRRFDYVITLCDRVREVCPEFPGAPERIHWSIADPTLEGDSAEESYPAFERTAAEIEDLVAYLQTLKP